MYDSLAVDFHWELRKGKTRIGLKMKLASAASWSGVKATCSGPVSLRSGQVSDDGIGLGVQQSGQRLARRRRRLEAVGRVEVKFARDHRHRINGTPIIFAGKEQQQFGAMNICALVVGQD
jgi:hypothetical protein